MSKFEMYNICIIKGECITMVGKRTEILKKFPEYDIAYENEGFFRLTKPSKVMAKIKQIETQKKWEVDLREASCIEILKHKKIL